MMAASGSGKASAAGKNELKSSVSDANIVSDKSEEADFSKKMTLQEKLDFIDGEIRKIHVFCTKSGYSSSQIESFAKPFFARDAHHFSTTIWVSGKAWKRRAVALATMIVATILLFRFDPAYRLACALSKQGAIQILPLWDWTHLYHSRCWVENPLYQSTPGLQLSDCEICEGTNQLERVKDLSGQDLIEFYVKRDVPVIVKDGKKDWEEAKANVSILELAQTFIDHPVLNGIYSCGFSTNIRARNSDHVDLLQKFKDGKLDRFYAHWENCNALAGKAFRSKYQRPYFLPSTVALSHSNWVFISANYSGKIYKPIDVPHQMLIFMQVKGETKLRLETWEPCTPICSQFEEILHEGEILVATDYLWKVDYIPSTRPENIAIALGGSYD